MGEHICERCNDMEIIFKIYKQLKQFNIKILVIIITQSKNGQKTEIDISPKKTRRWLKGT